MSGKTLGKYVLLGGSLLIVLLLTWGVLIEPRMIDERHETARIPNLPAAWSGKRVALVADFQVGMWFNNTDTIRRIVERLIVERPSAVLIAGDFVYKPTGEEELEDVREEYDDAEEFAEVRSEISKAVELVRPLTAAGIPVYAVLGNHDFAMNTQNDVHFDWLAREVTQELTKVGVRVLENEAAAMLLSDSRDSAQGGEHFYAVGVGPKWVNRSDPAAALRQLPADAPRLALMHNPQSFADFPAGTAPLALAGHTHGGQVRLPFLPKWTWMNLFSNETIYADGWIDGFGQPGNKLYVNRGIGFSSIPIRINCPPELTFITLQPAD